MVVRCLGSRETPGLESWREGGGHGAAFLMGERSEKGLSLFLCTLVSTQEHENSPEQICSGVLGIMTQRFFIPLPVTHLVQPHGPDSEQPNLFGLPLPKIPLNNCPLQSVVKNSGFFSLPFLKQGSEGESAAPQDHVPVTTQRWQSQHSPVTSCQHRHSPEGDKCDVIQGTGDSWLPKCFPGGAGLQL